MLPDDAVRLAVPLGPPAHRRGGAGVDGLHIEDVDRHDRLTAMREGRLGSVHSWELVTAVDGPGTRLTTFLNGCPLKCLYCLALLLLLTYRPVSHHLVKPSSIGTDSCPLRY